MPRRISVHAQVEEVAGACADLFQRSSAWVEGRNGQLSLHHRGRHRLSHRKLAALTAVPNIDIRCADGTMAAERFFGRAHPALVERLFFLRAYDSLNYTRFSLAALAGANRPLVLPFQRVSSEAAEGTAALLASGGD